MISLRRSAAYSLREQRLGGDLVELGIAVIGVAVGVGQLEGFHQGVNVVRGVELQALDVVAFQNVEGFEHAGSLAPEARLVDGVALEGGGDGVFRFDVEGGHVFVADQAAVRFGEGVDAVGDLAAVEEIAHGVDGLAAIGAGGRRALLGVGHAAEGARQVGLAEDVAGLRGTAVGQEGALAIGPRLQVFHAVDDGVDAHFVDGKAVGQFDGRLHDFGERFGAVLAQSDERRFHHAGHQGGQNSGDGNPVLEAIRLRAERSSPLR